MYCYKRLRDIREDNDEKQESVASVLNITRQQYQLYESGKRELPMHHFITLAKYYNMKYNDKEEYSRFDKYKTAVNKKEAHPFVGYELYRNRCLEIERELIGIKTVAGITVNDYSSHFVCRSLGATTWDTKDEGRNKREQGKKPVSVESIKNALTSGTVGKTKIDSNGKVSVLHIGNECMISVNPDTGVMVQANVKE